MLKLGLVTGCCLTIEWNNKVSFYDRIFRHLFACLWKALIHFIHDNQQYTLTLLSLELPMYCEWLIFLEGVSN